MSLKSACCPSPQNQLASQPTGRLSLSNRREVGGEVVWAPWAKLLPGNYTGNNGTFKGTAALMAGTLSSAISNQNQEPLPRAMDGIGGM